MLNEDLPEINFDLESYSELFDAYTSDLNKFIKVLADHKGANKPFIRRYLLNKLEEKWLPLLGFNASRIESDTLVIQTPEVDFVSSLTLKDVLKYYNTGASWVIPNLLRRTGLYLLGGEPKVGKSLLINFLIYALCRSGDFLGRPVKTGNVLYIQLEESLDTIADRLFLSGFGDTSNEETSLVVNFPEYLASEGVERNLYIEREFDLTTDLDWLVRKIQAYKPIVVIIDSLRAASVKANVSENSNEFGKLVIALQRVFTITDTCGVLVHHMSKLGGRNASKTSLIERLAGHTSITAACSGIIGISGEDTQDGRLMTLKTLPRNGTPINVKYKITSKTDEGGLWDIVKVWEDTPVNNECTVKILRYLRNTPNEYYSLHTIATAIGTHVKDVEFKKSITYLQDSQLIHSKYVNHRFVYCLPEDLVWLTESTSISVMMAEAILDANSLLGILKEGAKTRLRLLVSDWSKERQINAKNALLPEEKDAIKELIKSWEYNVGDTVLYGKGVCTIIERVGEPHSLSLNTYKLAGIEELVLEKDLRSYYPPEEDDLDLDDDMDMFDSDTISDDTEKSTLDKSEEVLPEHILDMLDTAYF